MERTASEFSRRHPVVILCYILLSVIWTMTTRHPMALFVSFLASGIYCVILRGVRQWARILFAGSGILLFAAGIRI